MDAGAELLWPDEEDLYTLMCMRVEGGRTAFEREKQNVPINPELCEWPEEYFDRPIWFDALAGRTATPRHRARSQQRRRSHAGDDSAFVLLGVDPRGVVYVEADLARRPTPQMVADGVEHCRRFRPDVLGIETNQFQELFAGEFAAAFAAARTSANANRAVGKHDQQTRPHPPPRPAALSHGRLRFKTHSRGTQRLVDQLRAFPIGDHDDGPDALEMAIRLADALAHRRDARRRPRQPTTAVDLNEIHHREHGEHKEHREANIESRLNAKDEMTFRSPLLRTSSVLSVSAVPLWFKDNPTKELS